MTQTASPPLPPTSGMPTRWPVYRTIVAIDLEGSTLRPNPVKGAQRESLYLLFAEALRRTGIDVCHLDRPTDRGDGFLTLIRPVDEIPKPLLLGPFLAELIALLAEHNAASAISPLTQLRLRMVIHAGDVHDDTKGFYGEELDVAFRLLDAPQVKRVLALAEVPLVLVVSDEIFGGIVRQGYGGIDPGAYTQQIRVKVANRLRRGWIHLPAIV